MRHLAVLLILVLGLAVLAGCSSTCGCGKTDCGCNKEAAICQVTGKTLADGSCPEADRCPVTGKTVAEGRCPEAERCPVTGKTSVDGECPKADGKTSQINGVVLRKSDPLPL